MSVIPPAYETLVKKAIATYWATLSTQANKQGAGDGDRGNRRAVTGGQQMNGFCELIKAVAEFNEMPETSVHVSERLGLPGFFRATKKWDLLVVHREHWWRPSN